VSSISVTGWPARTRRWTCERPLTGSKASSPRRIASSGQPAASAQAAAASAFFTLCQPATRNCKVTAPAGVCSSTAQ